MLLDISNQIATHRKKRGLTQEELAKLLGVTNQAVSKWEGGKCYPDIELLPAMADIFRCSIDALFGRGAPFREGDNTYELCTEFPWADDETFRGVVCKGRKILSIQSGLLHKFTFEYVGEAKSVKSHCNLSVVGDVAGGCHAGHSVSVNGNVSGACNAGHTIAVGGSINGGAACGTGIVCQGDIIGDVDCQQVTAKRIEGNVTCYTLRCDNVVGDIKAGIPLERS